MSILMAIDGRPSSEKVIKYAIDLARSRQEELVIMHVLKPRRSAINDKVIKEGLLMLDRIKLRASSFGVHATTLLETGSHYEKVIKAADDRKADVIVIGPGAEEMVGEPVIGSLAEHVVHHARCTVIIVR